MKASVTFREEKSPLIRMKFPVSLAGFHLASGITIGDNQDLALHLGTPPEAYPSVKIAYRPNIHASPLSLVIKAGIGPWGPPCLASLSMSAEVRFSTISSSPFFTMHVKPRLGDFSFRKMAKSFSLGLSADAHKNADKSHNHSCSRSHRRRQSHSGSHSRRSSMEASHMTMPIDDSSRPSMYDGTDAGNKAFAGSSSSIFDDSDAGNKALHRGVFDDQLTVTPLKLDKSSLFTPMPFGGPAFHKIHTSIPAVTDAVDSWGSDFVKIDEFDHSNRRSHDDDVNLSNRKSHGDQSPSFVKFKDHRSSIGSPLSASVGGGSCLNEEETDSAVRTGASVPLPWRLGVDEINRDWSLHAHSSLPLGAQTTLKIRWGVNAYCDLMRGWESQLSRIKVPYLYLQKISLVTTGSAMDSCNQGDFSKGGQVQSPVLDEEIQELSPVAALCGSMKRQLQLLYTENQVLKKAMEEMKTQFEQRSSGKQRIAENLADVLGEEQIGADSKGPDHPSEGRSSKVVKDEHEKTGVFAEKSRRNHANHGLGALKKLGGLGRGGVSGRSNSNHSMLD